jgi:hypothetical protein
MEFSEKNFLTILFIFIFSIGIFYYTYTNHIKNNFLDKDTTLYKKSRIYKGYIWGIGGVIISIFQLIKWLIQYINNI